MVIVFIRKLEVLKKYAIGFFLGIATALLLDRYSPQMVFVRHLSCPTSCVSGLQDCENDLEIPIDNAAPKKYSCNETFRSLGGNPKEFHGFVIDKCSNPAEDTTTTLILSNLVVTEKLAFENLIKTSLHKFARIILVAQKSEIALVKYTDWFSEWFGKKFFTVPVESFSSYGDAMNKAVDLVVTPLVLIAPRIAYINFNITGQKLDVQRLIRILETVHNAEVVGGAVKDVTNGHWARGCYQTRHVMYTLKYTAGYRRSFHGCLFCHHLSSPFLARTSFMRTVRFPRDNHGLIEDFFYQVKMRSKAVISCPDVMFYVNSMSESNLDLEKFGERRDVGQIIDDDGRKRKLLYFRNGPLDKHPLNKKYCEENKSLARHPGCRYNLLRFIQYICKTVTDAGFKYEVEDGTLLGFVKFDYILPWELDADINVIGPHKDIIDKLGPIWRGDGIEVDDRGVGSKNINLHKHGWKSELWIFDASPTDSHKEPLTRVNAAGEWLATVENPGFHMRRRYGQEIYQHAEHWQHTGKDTSWYPYTAGKFNTCKIPGDQGCLDMFRADGNMQFRGIM